MYTCISDFIKSPDKNGLLLLDSPTGFGKTYKVIKFINDFICDEKNKDKKIFFITTLKKNLPASDLKMQLENCKMPHIFNQRVLVLEPNSKFAVDNLNDEIVKCIPFEIRNTKEFKDFQDDVEFLQQKNLNPLFKETIENRFKNTTEPAFRYYLQRQLASKFKSKQERLFAIKTDQKWKWVGKLYPSVFTDEKQVIFMSMKKYLCPHSTIIEKPYLFSESSLVDNAIFFIDEFDSTKETVLSHIIENGLKEKIDYIDLFTHIYAVLQNKTFPERLFIAAENPKKKYMPLKTVMQTLKIKASEIFSQFSLMYNYKTNENTQQPEKNFLFNDHSYITILNGKNNFISTLTDDKNCVNLINFSEQKPLRNDNIQQLLGRLSGFIAWFEKAVYIFAINYFLTRKKFSKDGDEEFGFESALRSVISEFNLNSNYENYLFSQIMSQNIKPKNDITNSEYDLTFYENGFKYFSLENSPDYDFKSIISMTNFSNTPEKVLIKLCEKSKVVGISATASLPSLLCNYDLHYFSIKLIDKFWHPESKLMQSHIQRIKSDYNQKCSGYDKVEIVAELFDSNNYSTDLWKEIFDCEELACAAYYITAQAIGGLKDNNCFKQRRYYKIALAFKRFFENDEIRSFLCVLNKYPKSDDNNLNLDCLCKIIDLICDNNSKEYLFLLDGNDFDNKKITLLDRLAKGEKIFVISVYQTIGAGQNLQYDIPAELRDSLIKINDLEPSSQKDFDGIYLEKPTNLTVNLNTAEEFTTEMLVKFIFETKYLQEGAEISGNDSKENIKNAFSRCFMKKRVPYKGYKTESVGFYATKQIVQAIGRLCRTNMKQKHIYIFADSEIYQLFQADIADNQLLNFETLTLIDALKKYGEPDTTGSNLIYLAEHRSNVVNKSIHSILHEKWTDKNMRQWTELRDLALRLPTASEDDYKNHFLITQYYVKVANTMNKYYYSQKNDYQIATVSFSPSKNTNLEVSEQSAKLDRIMLFGEIRQYFESMGWATTFKKTNTLWRRLFLTTFTKGLWVKKQDSIGLALS